MARFTRCLSGYGLKINFVKNPIFVSVDRGCSNDSPISITTSPTGAGCHFQLSLN